MRRSLLDLLAPVLAVLGLILLAVGYGFVYCLEVVLLLGTLVAILPLARAAAPVGPSPARFGLAEMPT